MKFSIRDLFLVTLIVALAVGWWVDRSKLFSKVKRLRAKERLEQYAAEHELTIVEPMPFLLPNSSAPTRNPPKP
jgi:hypothetical protein